MDVPEMVFSFSSDPYHADVIDTPGAKMFTHMPKLEKEAMLSNRSVAPTVIAYAKEIHFRFQKKKLELRSVKKNYNNT